VVPVVGPVVLAFVRVALAAADLALYALLRRKRMALRGHWRNFLSLAFNTRLSSQMPAGRSR